MGKKYPRKGSVATTDTADVGAEDAPPVDAAAAYESRKAIWKKQGGSGLPPVRANVIFVASRVIQIGRELSVPGVLAAFKALEKVPLPGGPYDAGCVPALPVIGKALWFARTSYLTAEAKTATVSLPAKLLDDATLLRAKMLKVVEYHCADESNPDDPVEADLASIRTVQGPRYLDLATDLARLAAYYRDPRWLPILRADRQRYDAKDAARADQLSSDILAKLRQRDDTATSWIIELSRGWADLQATYDAVRRGASFVLWPDHDERVPPLGALRPAVSEKRKPKTPTPAPAPVPG